MWSSQQNQFGYDAENVGVFSPNQYVYPVQHEQGFVPQLDPIAQQYRSASPHQLAYPIYAQDAPQFFEFRDSEQPTFDPTISHQIDFFNRHIAKMLRSAEAERFIDPKFAEWCHGEAEYFLNFRDSLLRNEPTRKYGSERQIEHTLIEESSTLPVVEKQRVGNVEHQHLMGQSSSEIPGMVIRDQLDLPLDPTKILAKKLRDDDSSFCRTNSEMIHKSQKKFEPVFSFTSLFDLQHDEDPNETLPKWFFHENPDRNSVHENSKIQNPRIPKSRPKFRHQIYPYTAMLLIL